MVVLQKNIEAVILQEGETSVEGINAKLKELQKELLRLENSKRIIVAWWRRLIACVT